MSSFKNIRIKPNEINMTIYASQGDIGSVIAMHKLVELHNVIAFANYAINKAICEKDNIIKFSLFRSAILDYNSCYDYVRQIVYFGFDFCPFIGTHSDYNEVMKNGCLLKQQSKNNVGEITLVDTPFKQKIDNLKNTNVNAKVFFGKLNKYRKSLLNSSVNITEWANSIKHRGGFAANELIDKSKLARVITTNNTGGLLFDSSFTLDSTSFLEIENKLSKQNEINLTFIDYLQDSIFGDTTTISDLSKSNKIFSAEGYDKNIAKGNSYLINFENNGTK